MYVQFYLPSSPGIFHKLFYPAYFTVPDPCLCSPCDSNAVCQRGSVLTDSFNCTCTSPYQGDGFVCSCKYLFNFLISHFIFSFLKILIHVSLSHVIPMLTASGKVCQLATSIAHVELGLLAMDLNALVSSN